MLPDKKEWEKEFVGSSQYKKILNRIYNLPEPEFVPFWDPAITGTRYHARLRFYMLRLLPLQSFYILDYINKQTSGGSIINMHEAFDFFEGIYNVKKWDAIPVANKKIPSIFDLQYTKQRLENSFCVMGYTFFNFEVFEKIIVHVARATDNYGYLAFDSCEMLKQTSSEFVAQHELSKYYKRVAFVDDVVTEFSKYFDVLLYENHMPYMHEYPDHPIDPIDGDIRILFKAKPSTKV